MPVLLIFFAVSTVINAVILWIAIRIVAPACEKNTPLYTLIFSAVLVGTSLIPFLGLILPLVILIGGLLMTYELGVGQMFMVLLVIVGINIFLVGFIRDLVGVAAG